MTEEKIARLIHHDDNRKHYSWEEWLPIARQILGTLAGGELPKDYQIYFRGYSLHAPAHVKRHIFEQIRDDTAIRTRAQCEIEKERLGLEVAESERVSR